MALSNNPTLVEIVNEIERLNNLIVDRGGARTITPSTDNQLLLKGNYKGEITVLGDTDLIPSNILLGKNIFGVDGSITAQSIGAKTFATGTVGTKITDSYTIPISINFTPSLVFVKITNMSAYGSMSQTNGYICNDGTNLTSNRSSENRSCTISVTSISKTEITLSFSGSAEKNCIVASWYAFE